MGLFDFVKGKPKRFGPYSGGSGASLEDAVIITVPSSLMGVPAEYEYVEMQCGRQDVDWEGQRQDLLEKPYGKCYDLLTVKLKDGTIRKFYFDISSFYGKF